MTFEIKGLEELRRKLNQPIVREEAKDAMEKAQALVVHGVAKYPPPPPNSRYRRTGFLGRSWLMGRVQLMADNMTGIVENRAPYAPDVQGPDQLPLFTGIGWERVGDVATRVRDEIVGFFETALQNAARRLGD